MESRAPDMVPVFVGIFSMFVLFIGLIVTILMIWVYCRIFSKAGYSWALGLLMIVPVANIIMPFVLAFGDWPILRELRLTKQKKDNTA